MFTKLSDTRPTADIEYLSSAIIRDALTQKFEDLFGQTPILDGPEYPLHLTNARVPSMVSNSVDADIAKMLKSSAIEASDEAEGTVPEVDRATLLYMLTDTDPATVNLSAVQEYNEMDSGSKDATISAVSDLPDINIDNGTAYLSSDKSAIDIGIFVDNEMFGQEFQYRLETAGGDQLPIDKKVEVFDNLYDDLPGGDDQKVPNLRQELLKIVGLTSALTPEQKAKGNEAPGPEPMAKNEQTQTQPSA